MEKYATTPLRGADIPCKLELPVKYAIFVEKNTNALSLPDSVRIFPAQLAAAVQGVPNGAKREA